MGIDYDIHIFNSQIYEITSIKSESNGSDGFDEVIIKRKDGKMFEKGVDPFSDYLDFDCYEDIKPNEINQFQRTFLIVKSIEWYDSSNIRKWKETGFKYFLDKYKCIADDIELYAYRLTDKDSVFVLVATI